MEFPFGHSRHSHHERQNEEERHRHHHPEEEHHRHHHGFPHVPPVEPYGAPPPSYPPAAFRDFPNPYPPPGTLYPEPQSYPPPEFPRVHHVAHEGPSEVVHQVAHESFHRPEVGPPCDSFPRPDLPRGQVVRVFCKADPDFSLTIRNGTVLLAHANANDPFQQWIKDEKYSTKVKDQVGYPSFSLVNKATGQALKHGLGETQPVLLTEYRPDTFDESILWTQSEDMGQGYRTLREVNDIRLNVDAFHGDKKSGGIKDGTPIVLWGWKKGENQLWKIVPYCKS